MSDSRSAGSSTTPSPGPGRREARERAIGLLYEREARSLAIDELFGELPLDPDPYTEAAVRGIATDASGDGVIDALIEEHSEGWSLHRMPRVDAAILRLAVWELRARDDVPTAVVLDEAVELAKAYSTERSPAFVNGVLDAIAALVRH